MSSLLVATFVLLALAALVVAALVQIARRPLWSRLILVAILTRIFDRPHVSRPVRVRL